MKTHTKDKTHIAGHKAIMIRVDQKTIKKLLAICVKTGDTPTCFVRRAMMEKLNQL